MPTSCVELDASNANRGDVPAVQRSLNVFGQRKPIVAKCMRGGICAAPIPELLLALDDAERRARRGRGGSGIERVIG